MNVLLEAAIAAVVGNAVGKWANAPKKIDAAADPIPKASVGNPAPQQPMAASARDTNYIIAYPGKTIPLILKANGQQMGDRVPGTTQIISAPPVGKKVSGSPSTTIFAQQTDPADAGNISQANRVGDFYYDPLTNKKVATGPIRFSGTSGGVYMLMAEHAGTPAETINDPQTAVPGQSLTAGTPALVPGTLAKVLPLNATQKIPIGAKWARLANV